MAEHRCKDCIADPPATIRKLVADPAGAPRCTTHERAFKLRQRKLAKASHTERTYDISAEDNHDLFLYQRGKCWICGKATGASKSLATEHDHKTDWVRGRCCSTCNQFITRQLDDDPKKARRLVSYLSGDTPFRRMLAERMIRRSDPAAEILSIRLTVHGQSGSVIVRYQSGGFFNEIHTTLGTLNTYRNG